MIQMIDILINIITNILIEGGKSANFHEPDAWISK